MIEAALNKQITSNAAKARYVHRVTCKVISPAQVLQDMDDRRVLSRQSASQPRDAVRSAGRKMQWSFNPAKYPECPKEFIADCCYMIGVLKAVVISY